MLSFLSKSLATDNLQGYIRLALLPQMINGAAAPEMPQAGHRSHRNGLRVHQESYRLLHTIQRFDGLALNTALTEYIDSYIPDSPLGVPDIDEETGERMSVPARFFDIPSIQPARPYHIDHVTAWLQHFPLQTVQRMFHLLWPSTSKWCFLSDDVRQDDRAIFDTLFWTLPARDGIVNSSITDRSVVVAIQPPWILSPEDIQDFVDCTSMRKYRGSETRPLSSRERLWAKLWDVCVMRDCRWFVLTNYSQLVVGHFSEGRTTAFVSPVYSSSDEAPTFLEVLVYWLSSAMQLEAGSLCISKVAENEHPGGIIISNSSSYARSVAESASAYSEAHTDAGVDDMSLNDIHPPRARHPTFVDRVRAWHPEVLAASDVDDHSSLQSHLDLAPSEWSATTTSTVRGNNGMWCTYIQ